MHGDKASETRFVGSIPELYDRHLGPVLFEPFAKDLVARLPATARRVLEVAAGTGRVTRHLLATLPRDAELLATDLNQPMIDVGQLRTGADPRVRWQVADAQALPAPAASIDTVVCQFGLMFVPDKALALREMCRVLRPGGRLLLSTWDRLEENLGSKLLQDYAFETFPDDPPLFMQVPFSLHDTAALRELATTAGFSEVRVDTVRRTGEAVSAADLAVGFVRGNPLANQLADRGVDVDAFHAEVTRRLARAFGEAPCRFPMVVHVMTARAPGG